MRIHTAFETLIPCWPGLSISVSIRSRALAPAISSRRARAARNFSPDTGALTTADQDLVFHVTFKLANRPLEMLIFLLLQHWR